MTIEASRSISLLLRLTTNMGTETAYQYTDSARPVVHSSLGSFTPKKFDVDLQDQSGRSDDETIEIEIEKVDPLGDYGDFASHAPVEVELYMVYLDDIDNTDEVLFKGRLSTLRVNADNRLGVYHMECSGPKKTYEDRPLGIPAVSSCIWRFGRHGCDLDVDSLEESVTVTSISGTSVTVSGMTTTTEKYWTNGYAYRGALAIDIVQYEGGSDTFQLIKPPPTSWVGQTLTLRPGCDKSLSGERGCRTWANEARFMACGIAIPEEDPSARFV